MFRSSRVDAFGEVRPDCLLANSATAAGRGALWAACTPPASGTRIKSTAAAGRRAQAQPDHPALSRGTRLHCTPKAVFGLLPADLQKLASNLRGTASSHLVALSPWVLVYNKAGFWQGTPGAALNKQLPAPPPSRHPRRGTEQEVPPPLQKRRHLADSGLCSQGLRAFPKVHISRPCSCTWRASVGSGSLTAQRFPE